MKNYKKKFMLFLENSLIKKEYLIILLFLIFAIVLAGYVFMTKFELLVNYLQENEKDFYKFVKIISFIIFIIFTVVSFCLNFIVLYRNFSLNTVYKYIKKISTNLKIEIKGLNFSYRSLFFGLVFFITFLFLMMFNYIKLAFLFLFFGTLSIIKDLPSIRSLNNELAMDNVAISDNYIKNYKFIYYSSKFIKIIFYIYVPYFFIWCLVGKSYIVMEHIINWQNSQIMLDQIMLELSQSGKTLYLLYYLFLNSLVLDYFMESLIIYLDYSDQILIFRILLNLSKRVVNFTALAVGGGAVVGGVVVYSPLVEIPGVNEFQIKYGRGYGYKTSLDYVRGTIYQSYLSKEQMEALIQINMGEDRILDGIFFRLLSEDKDVVQIMHKNATINELRFLGLRRW